MDAVIYCRVGPSGSAEMQCRALGSQRLRLEQYAQTQGLNITGYYQDAGYSGHDTERPGLAQLLEAARSGAVQAVLVWDRTRLFRGSIGDEPNWPFQVLSANPLERSCLEKRNR